MRFSEQLAFVWRAGGVRGEEWLSSPQILEPSHSKALHDTRTRVSGYQASWIDWRLPARKNDCQLNQQTQHVPRVCCSYTSSSPKLGHQGSSLWQIDMLCCAQQQCVNADIVLMGTMRCAGTAAVINIIKRSACCKKLGNSERVCKNTYISVQGRKDGNKLLNYRGRREKCKDDFVTCLHSPSPPPTARMQLSACNSDSLRGRTVCLPVRQTVDPTRGIANVAV